MPERSLPAEVYAHVFEATPEGQQILDELVRRFHARGSVTDGGIDAILKTYHRDGAKSVVQFIINRINQARGVDDDGTDEQQ